MNANQPTPARRNISKKVQDPKEFFACWKFDIPPHHFATLGVTFRQFVKNKKPYRAWATMDPPENDFCVGDIFYDKADPFHFIQVAAETDAFRLEVHEGRQDPSPSIDGYIVTIAGLRRWLESGERENNLPTVDTGTSKAGLLAWRLRRPEHQPTAS